MALTIAARGHAEIDGQVFTSRAERVKVTIPKGFRPSELPSYPGVLLYLLRSNPEGRIIIGSEPLRQQLYCSWPAKCREMADSLEKKYACALREQLDKHHNVGTIQPGPKENSQAGLPSVWFEYTDGKRFVRLALAVNQRRAVTFVLTTASAADRATHARSFDQVLRSLKELSDVEALPVAPSPEAGVSDARAPEAAPAATPEATPAASPAAAGPEPAGAVAGEAREAREAPATPRRLSLPLFDPSSPCPQAAR